jgi:hypothetical protein
MAGNAVQVTFGANIQPLIEGVNSIKEQIAGLGEAARVLAGAFVGGETADFVDRMAEMGEQIERSAAMLGASVKTTQEFGYAAKMTGGDAQSMATAMERFEVSLQKAQNPTSQQALALHALGLSAKELIGLPLEQQMDKFADAVARFADSPEKTAAIGAINRGFVQMIPLLDEGSEGLRRMRDQAENTGAVMTGQTVKALSDLDHQITGAKASLEAMAGTLTALAAKTLGDFASGVATSAGHLTALASSGNLSAYVFGYLDEIIDNLGYRFVALAHAIGNLSTLNFAHLASDWARDEAALLENAKTEGADLDKILNGAIDSYKKLIAMQDQINKPKVGALDVGGADATKAAAERAQAAIKAADESYKATAQQLQAEYKLHQITYDQETQKLMEALGVRYQAEITALADEEKLYAQGSSQWQKVVDQEMAVYQKYLDDKRKLTEQANEQDAKDWDNLLKPVQSAWDSQLRGLLAGTTTWAKAMKNIFADLVLDIIKALENAAIAKAAAMLATALGGPSQLAQHIAPITADSGQAYAGFAAFLAPVEGPAALAHAAALAAAVQATATGMASLDVGGTLLSDGVYYGHAGETVVPAQVNMPYQGGAGGGGAGGGGAPQINLNGSFMGTQAWTNSMIQQLARALTSYQNRTPSMNYG